MELFRVGGLSSEDLMRRDGGSAPRQFLGTMFRMGVQAPAAAPAADPGKDEGDAGQDDAGAAPEGDGTVRYSASQLGAFNKAKLTEIASSLGVVNLEQTNAKLAEAILERQ